MMSLAEVEDMLQRQNASAFKVYDHYFEQSGVVAVPQGDPVNGGKQVVILTPKLQLPPGSGVVIRGIKNIHLQGQGLDSTFWDLLDGQNPKAPYKLFSGMNPGETWRDVFAVLLPGSVYSLRATNFSGSGGAYPPGVQISVFVEITGFKFSLPGS